MYMLYVWLGVVCLGLLIESINAGTLVTIWFSVGAIVPLVMSFWGITDAGYITAQVIVFGVVTTLCLIFLRGISKKTLFKAGKDKTNLDMQIGKKYTISNIYHKRAYIKFNGIEYWVVLDNDDEDDETLQLGEKVEILRFSGNKAIVKKFKK